MKSIKDAGVKVHGCSHITGGGFYENIPRMLPEDKLAVIRKDAYEVPAIFKLMAKKGNVSEEMMYNTYNMGIGMLLSVAKEDEEATVKAIRAAGEECFVIGHVEDGKKGVKLC
jgi:phosphoribosylformylglycinamidine cyclo-ligase